MEIKTEWSFKDEDLPIVVAHRGASRTHPENTLAAFEAALEAGAQAVELDVRLTADGIPVVMHDPDVSRTTDGSGSLSGLLFAQVRELDAAPGRDARAVVPSLREVLDLVSGRGGVDLEIKGAGDEPGRGRVGEREVERVLEVLEASGFRGPVLVSSFNPETIARCRDLAPDLATGLLVAPGPGIADSLDYVVGEGHRFLLPHVSAVRGAGGDVMRQAHGAGVRIGVWVVDDEATFMELLSWGVDAVATNDPEMGAEALAEFRAGAGRAP